MLSKTPACILELMPFLEVELAWKKNKYCLALPKKDVAHTRAEKANSWFVTSDESIFPVFLVKMDKIGKRIDLLKE